MVSPTFILLHFTYMYFQSRAQAGEQLAARLMPYRYENCAVVALNKGGVAVGEPIAASLHAVLSLFLSEKIGIPGEDVTIGTVDQGGGFTYNQQMSEGEVDDYYSEFHGYIDDQKREQFQHINRLLIDGGALEVDKLREHVVILVADGLQSTSMLDAVSEFLKPVTLKRLIVAVPIASVAVVDRMHIMADELHCLAVTDNYLDTGHYYDTDDTPTQEQAIEKINNIILRWR